MPMATMPGKFWAGKVVLTLTAYNVLAFPISETGKAMARLRPPDPGRLRVQAVQPVGDRVAVHAVQRAPVRGIHRRNLEPST